MNDRPDYPHLPPIAFRSREIDLLGDAGHYVVGLLADLGADRDHDWIEVGLLAGIYDPPTPNNLATLAAKYNAADPTLVLEALVRTAIETLVEDNPTALEWDWVENGTHGDRFRLIPGRDTSDLEINDVRRIA
jgi:hypothetical protein